MTVGERIKAAGVDGNFFRQGYRPFLARVPLSDAQSIGILTHSYYIRQPQNLCWLIGTLVH